MMAYDKMIVSTGECHVYALEISVQDMCMQAIQFLNLQNLVMLEELCVFQLKTEHSSQRQTYLYSSLLH